MARTASPSPGAEAFRILTGGRELVGPYRFCSPTIKGLERRLDGIFEPDGHDEPVSAVEFQGVVSNPISSQISKIRSPDFRQSFRTAVPAERRRKGPFSTQYIQSHRDDA